MLLLLIIYIAFIGLGLPDSLFGTAWPAIYADLGLPFSFGSFITLLTSTGTIISSLMSDTVINRFGTHKVTLISTALTALAILGISLTGNMLFFCLFAIPLGLGAGAIDTALNNYVALHYTPAQMSFLHCFYGIGVTLSPFILSILLQGQYGWRGGYFTVFLLQLAITLMLLFSKPLWKQDGPVNSESQEIITLSARNVLKLKGIFPTLTLFFTSVALEMTCGAWGATYLVENLGMSSPNAASTIMFYFIGIAVGRFLSGLLASRYSGWTIIHISMILLLTALLILVLSKSVLLVTLAFLLIGMGNGPMFPNLSYMTPQKFGQQNSTSVMGIQLAVSNTAMMLMPALFGLMAKWLSMNLFPYFLLACYAGMVFAYLVSDSDESKVKTPKP